jgi:hypothetical protein
LIKEGIAVKKHQGTLGELVPLKGQSPYFEKGGVHWSNGLQNSITTNLQGRPPIFFQEEEKWFP